MYRSVLLACVTFTVVAPPAEAQFGRGLRRYRAQETKSYQFGYTPTYEIVVMNASLQDLEFHLAAHKSELQKWSEQDTTWIVQAGAYGTIGVMALDMQGFFETRRGIRVPARVDRGSYYALFYVDEEVLREFESRDARGAIVIRTPSGFKNPDIPETRLTTLTDSTRRLRRAFDLLPSPYDRPGPKGEFLTLERSRFEEPPNPEDAVEGLDVDVDDQGGATSGRIRQPGEELIRLNVTDAAGDPAAGARFMARIGHGLAYRTESGNVDGNGIVRLFTTRDDGIHIDLRVVDRGRGEVTVPIVPSRQTSFNVRLR